MFGLFKIKKKELVNNEAYERVVYAVVSKIFLLQKHWAVFMQRKTENLSTRTKKIAVILFCILAGGYSFYSVIDSFPAKKKKIFMVTNIQTPKHVTEADKEDKRKISVLLENEYRNIDQFRRYIDSLSGSESGKKIADSILSSKPGLMDNIIELQKLYQLQNLKK